MIHASATLGIVYDLAFSYPRNRDSIDGKRCDSKEDAK